MLEGGPVRAETGGLVKFDAMLLEPGGPVLPGPNDWDLAYLCAEAEAEP